MSVCVSLMSGGDNTLGKPRKKPATATATAQPTAKGGPPGMRKTWPEWDPLRFKSNVTDFMKEFLTACYSELSLGTYTRRD